MVESQYNIGDQRYKVIVLDEQYRPVLEGFTRYINLDCEIETEPFYDDIYNVVPRVWRHNPKYTMTVEFIAPEFKQSLVEVRRYET